MQHYIQKSLVLALSAVLLSSSIVWAQDAPLTTITRSNHYVRLKDIGKIIESRDNQLIGYGLVVGLKGSGDSRLSVFTNKALTNLLKRMGVSAGDKEYRSRNVASVIVTADLPPYIKPGQRLSVQVSSLGDASSLNGGTLLMTPLQGADQQTYAVAQGPVIVGGVQAQNSRSRFQKNQTTVGRVSDGAIVERAIPVTLSDHSNITIVLDEPNFITASRVSVALGLSGFEGAQAVDPSTIKIPLYNLETMTFVEAISRIENVEVLPDVSSKVVINSRTGTVVIGEKVRLYPVAITQGNISIKIQGLKAEAAAPATTLENGDDIQVVEGPSRVIHLEPESSLASLVDSLNQLGVSSKDLISILQALKESGSLVATLEVL